jgi:hypothetical protein
MKARTLFILAAAVLCGCESPREKTADAEEARHAADQKIAEVNQTTEQKEAEVQRKAAEEIARIERQGAVKVEQVEGVANRKADEANDALWKARAKARDGSAKRLEGFDQQILDLQTKLEKRLSASELATVMGSLRAKATAARQSILDLERSTADNLDAMSKGVDARLDELEHAIADAKKRV